MNFRRTPVSLFNPPVSCLLPYPVLQPSVCIYNLFVFRFALGLFMGDAIMRDAIIVFHVVKRFSLGAFFLRVTT